MHVVGYIQRGVLTHPRTGADTHWRLHRVVQHYRTPQGDRTEAIILVKRTQRGDRFAGAYSLGEGMLVRGETVDHPPVDEDYDYRTWMRLRDEAASTARSEADYWAQADAESEEMWQNYDERDQYQ